jgi:catechol 2,3-dioxygenase-like lactoylglutathione lyase family enzyme
MTLEVTAVDHIYVAVSDLSRAVAFYDPLMKLLGFRKGTKPIAGEPHVHYFNRVTQYSLRPARGARGHDPYSPGLHHLCFRLPDREQVDMAAREIRGLGIEVSEPRLYPEYADDYYGTSFVDPDGIRLELVAMRRLRQLVRDHWDQLTEFENPVAKAGLT